MKIVHSSLGAAALFGLSLTTAAPASAAPAKNIVLTHGMLLDGSGWRAVYDILVRKSYKVTIVQESLTGIDADVAATKRVLDQQDGPVVLVGHSYGGAVITQAEAMPRSRRWSMWRHSSPRSAKRWAA